MFNRKFLQIILAGIIICLTGIFQTALADQAACMPLKYEKTDDGEGGNVVYTAVPLFPNAVPPVPRPTFPLNPLVVEGNDGQFVQIGSNATHLEFARFHWKPSTQTIGLQTFLQFPFLPIFRLGFTTHYEICVFQDGRDKRCEDEIAPSGDNNGQGFLKMFARCSDEIHLVNGMRGLSPSSGSMPRFTPQFAPAIGPQVMEIFWMMRACNLKKCSDWTDKTSLYWVPVPTLRAPTFTTTRNSMLVDPSNPNTDFPVTFIWNPAAGIRTGTRYVPPSARLCIASPGTSCISSGSNSPGAFDDPWVANVNVPNSIGVGITATVNYFDSNNHIFGFAGETVHWSAANCWKLPSGTEICVYNNQVGTVSFLH